MSVESGSVGGLFFVLDYAHDIKRVFFIEGVDHCFVEHVVGRSDKPAEVLRFFKPVMKSFERLYMHHGISGSFCEKAIFLRS